jgi:hypothetical protein
MMSCPDCGEMLDDVPVGQPCPQCGGLRRDARALAQTATAKVEAFMPTIAIGYGDPRPWEQKWQDVLHSLQQIERAYTTRDFESNEDIRRAVEGFFKTCRELADWLWQNGGLEKSAVMKFVLDDPHLRLADAVAQTTKHHTRHGKDDPITARIVEIRSSPVGVTAKIGWSRASGATGSEDARDLARECVQAWRKFLGL